MTQDDKQAPREWRIYSFGKRKDIDGPQVDAYFNVIERSAYDALEKDRNELKTHCEMLRDGARMVTIEKLEAELATAKAEIVEQCRINGMGQERELKLIAEIERLQKPKFTYDVCLHDPEIQKQLQSRDELLKTYSSMLAKCEKAIRMVITAGMCRPKETPHIWETANELLAELKDI